MSKVGEDHKKKEYNLIGSASTQPEYLDETRPKDNNLIEFMFKIEGMTCVACSGSIERLMHNQFDAKGMESVSIVLLTHKM